MKSFKIKNEVAVVVGRTITVYFLLVSTMTGEVIEAKGTAKCSPEDKFNFQYGRDLAFKRGFQKSMGKLLKSIDKFQREHQRQANELRSIYGKTIDDGLNLFAHYDMKTDPDNQPEEKEIPED